MRNGISLNKNMYIYTCVYENETKLRKKDGNDTGRGPNDRKFSGARHSREKSLAFSERASVEGRLIE